MKFRPTVLGKEHLQLREEVRAFVAEHLPRGSYEPGLGMAGGHSPEFSQALAERGWVGMSIPQEYGGRGRSAVERFVVIEELLAVGAPISAHWIADRQTGPSILKFGTEEQKRRFLPAICAGTSWWSLGMSEPDSGSDLASVRTTAAPAPGGWLLNGTKVWTSGAHRNHYFAVLCRTSQEEGDRHGGLSQLIVDLTADGVDIRPIPFLDGGHHFNEVVLHDVFVPDEDVLGAVGSGWQQITSELAHERSGPDRYMSTYLLFESYVRERLHEPVPTAVVEALGRLTARYWTLRQLSLSIAAALDAGSAPAVEASIVKDLGTLFEQEVADVIATLDEADPELHGDTLYDRLLAQSVLSAPSFTLRGGTTEVLRGITARGLGVR